MVGNEIKINVEVQLARQQLRFQTNKKVKKVKLQKTDLEVAPINFGGNVFGWTLNEQQSYEILDSFTDAGFNFIDTADTYAWWLNGKGGQSETIIGNWMRSRGNREKLVIATKVG